MIRQSDVSRLFETMSNDMRIPQFEGEELSAYRQRLLYSALGKWIMQLFSDRDFENEENDQVSKAHVTISALDIIRSFKKISPEAVDFFKEETKTVNEIEDIYLNLGYINSGTYAFKYPTKRKKINTGNRSLIIDLDTDATRYYGLGLYGKIKETDTSLDDAYIITDIALDYFNKLVKNLRYEIFDSSKGKIEIYNIEYNRWDFFNDRYIKKYEYSILKIDGGLDYKIVKLSNGETFSASLPVIYCHSGTDDNFKWEVWRVILGLCAYNGKPATAVIRNYYTNGIKVSFGGFIIPFDELSLLKCMAWPLGDSLNIKEFVAAEPMEKAIVDLLKHLSIEVIRERDNYGA